MCMYINRYTICLHHRLLLQQQKYAGRTGYWKLGSYYWSIAQKRNMEEPIFFFSRSRHPYCLLSNFYEVDIEMSEGVFPSVEHYFQGMKFIPKDRIRFTEGGEFDKVKASSGATNARPEVAKGRLAKSAGSKSGSAKYKLTLAPDGLDREVAKDRMKRALEEKFRQEPFKSVLLETGATRPLIHIPTRGQTDFWTGKRDKKTGEIVGENTMGKLLMEVREFMLEKKSEQDQDIVTENPAKKRKKK